MSDEPEQGGHISHEELAPYAGRWVAIAEGRIAGVGETARAAERLGRRNRVREKLELHFIELPGGARVERPELIERLTPIFERHDQPVFLVGGMVRDLLLGRSSKDLDFAVPNSAIELAFKIANFLGVPAYVLDKERDTGRVILLDEGLSLDISAFRGENIVEDLRDRDFTINALALPVAARSYSSLIDPINGQDDLRLKTIRQTHDKAIANDPVRAMRAIRISVQLNFSLDVGTSAAVRLLAPSLSAVSVERVRDELILMMGLDAPDQALQAMSLQGILPEVIPEVAELEYLEQSPPHREPVLAHTIHVLESLRWIESVLIDSNSPGGPTASQLWLKLGSYQERLRDYFSRPIHGRMDGRGLLRLGALFHDVGKSRTVSIGDDGRIRFIGHEQEGADIADYRLRKLRLSNEAVSHIRKVVLGHMWPFHLVQNETLTRRAVFRFFKRTGSAGLDIGLLSLADYLATHGGARDGGRWERHLSVIEQLYDHYFHHYDETVRPLPIINGQQLMQALDIGPGPEIGRLLSVIEEAQAAGEISTQQDAVTLAADNFRKA